MAAIETRCATAAIAVRDAVCHHPRAGKGPPRDAETCHVVLVRRGVFAAHVATSEYIADPCTALVSPAGVEYRIGHPGTCGDDGTILELAPTIAEELLGVPRMREIALSSRARAATTVFEARSRHATAADVEEMALELARSLLGPERPTRTTPGHERRRIAQAAIVDMHEHLAHNVPVSTLARRIGCSPFHLMHVFQAATGTTVRRYRIRLRIAAALERLAAGHDDLATLALDLGFASHAHLSDVFRDEVGTAPSQLRRTLTRAARVC